MRRLCKIFLLMVCTGMTLSSCREKIGNTPEGGTESASPEAVRYYANIFAYNCMKTFYLWVDEIADGLAAWKTYEDPIAKVQELRYKNSEGKDIDKWTMLSDNFSSTLDYVEGVSTTYGTNIALMYIDAERTGLCMVVRLCSAGSPADKAGIRRGDVIMKVNDRPIPADNWERIVYDEFLNAPSCKVTLADGRSFDLRAVEMYEEPVYLWKTFDCGGKKVGYLVYNKFTLDSCEKLIEACTELKAEGISELILDMRYNGGGYVHTEYTLASMLAPRSNVDNRDVYETAVYNSLLAQAYDDGEKTIRFTDRFNFRSNGKTWSFSTEAANLGITKIYAILGSGSASASESIIVGLGPYMDIEIIGEQSRGKYCSGMLYPASTWFEDYRQTLKSKDYLNGKKSTKNWGIYVMISRYADRNGYTGCMPDGFVPDIPVFDDPLDGWQLGDEHETMLRIALERAGKTDISDVRESAPQRRAAWKMEAGPSLKSNVLDNARIFLPDQL